jgi:hypothetical protein
MAAAGRLIRRIRRTVQIRALVQSPQDNLPRVGEGRGPRKSEQNDEPQSSLE